MMSHQRRIEGFGNVLRGIKPLPSLQSVASPLQQRQLSVGVDFATPHNEPATNASRKQFLHIQSKFNL